MILVNASIEGLTRYEREDNVDYFVVPTVAIVEGVLNDSLVLMSELEASLWEVPIVIDHPMSDGSPISAKTDGVSTFGTFKNVVIEDGKMRGESWFDIRQAARDVEAARVLNLLQSGGMVEVSSAYFAELNEEPGVFGNRSYTYTTSNILPDHLAFLPDQQGACSIIDGCGAPRTNNLTQETTMRDIIVNILTEHGLSPEALDAMTDEELLAAYEDNREPVQKQEPDEEPVTNEQETPTPSKFEAFFANHSEDEVLDILQRAVAHDNSEREGFVSVIVANSDMEASDLEGLKTAALEKMAKAFKPQDANYAGASPFINRDTSEWEDYTTPTM